MGSGARLGTSSTVGAATMGWLSIGTTRAGGAGMTSGGPSERAWSLAHALVPAASAIHAATRASLFTQPLWTRG
jgi:hypothetical protein